VDLVWAPYDIPTPQTEYKFHPTRKWRFDYAFLQQRIAVEIEGAIWTHGRHTRGAGFVKDIEKYNAAAKLGWRIFRFSPSQLKRGEAQTFIKEVMEGDK
jgi:very-short-patch-repair endonuclease